VVKHMVEGTKHGVRYRDIFKKTKKGCNSDTYRNISGFAQDRLRHCLFTFYRQSEYPISPRIFGSSELL